MKLPDVADLTVAEFGRVILGECIDLQPSAMDGARGWTVQGSQNVQQSAFAGARLAHEREHGAFFHLERQILKEHEFGFA